MLCRRRRNIHLIRNSFRYASRKDCHALSRDPRPIYAASSEFVPFVLSRKFTAPRSFPIGRSR